VISYVVLAGDHSNPLIPEWNELLWGAVCFLLLFAMISKLVFPKINATFAERTDNIEGKLDQAERERQVAQELLKAYQKKLDDAAMQAQHILDQARANAELLEEELRIQAEDQARRIVERAQQTIDAERERAVVSLRAEVGGIAVDLASRVVQDSLDRERQLKLVDQYIKELPTVVRGN
jgi:F-type H+-transporting ATPase subunit b